jgi:hypothetical protein
MTIRLITANPDAIVDFCKAHPVDLKDAWRKETNRGGMGDIKPPTPAADAFFHLYLEEKGGDLPTQGEYAAYCATLWHEWYQLLTPLVRQCFEARLYRNFYPSFIDSIHVWALLGTRYYANNHLVFDRCILDTYADVVTKADLLTYRGEECLRIALRIASYAARQAGHWKQAYRQTLDRQSAQPCVEILLPLSRAKIGGKRWYHWPEDFQVLFRIVEQLWLPGFAQEVTV